MTNNLNGFYSVAGLQQADNALRCTIRFNREHDIFSGHFPGQPVVPGVCTMAIIKGLLEEATQKKLLLSSASNVKFLQLILPDVSPSVHLAWQSMDNTYTLTASLRWENKDIFKMSAVYRLLE